MRVAPAIKLTTSEKLQLERYRKARSASVRLKERAGIILLAAEGFKNHEIAERLGQDAGKVGRWRNRHAEHGLEAILKDKTRPGRIAPISPSIRSKIIELTINSKPEAATHWSRVTMARKAGVSPSTVGRVWAAHGLKPHRTTTFKLSNDKKFQEKLEDIVGLYLSPPEHAIVLSCDEKSQMQALDRTQPGLPLKRGRAQTMTHDYVRHGTTSLFAALNVQDGSVIGSCEKKHRHQEWIKFLNQIKRGVSKDKEVHLICDNYATHKHAKVKAWFARNKRFHCHFTPTSASWLNMVERFFRDLSEHRIRRGVFKSVSELENAVDEYLQAHNKNPKPFIWTAKATDILAKVKRARKKLINVQSV